MKLKHARLCLDCETIHDGYICPCCMGVNMFPIASWLDRDPTLAPATAEVVELERIFRLKDA